MLNYEIEEIDMIKNKKISIIFPDLLIKKQTKHIVNSIKKNHKDSFSLKLVILDKNKNIKYLDCNFRIVVSIDMKFFILCEINDEENDIFIVDQYGCIIKMSESLIPYLEKMKTDQINLFEILKIERDDISRESLQNKKLELVSENQELNIYFENKILFNLTFYYIFLVQKENIRTKFENSLDLDKDKIHEIIQKDYNNNSSTKSSLVCQNYQKLKKLISNNVKIFDEMKKISNVNKIEYLLYIYNFLLILSGLIFILFFNTKLNYHSYFTDGMY